MRCEWPCRAPHAHARLHAFRASVKCAAQGPCRHAPRVHRPSMLARGREGRGTEAATPPARRSGPRAAAQRGGCRHPPVAMKRPRDDTKVVDAALAREAAPSRRVNFVPARRGFGASARAARAADAARGAPGCRTWRARAAACASFRSTPPRPSRRDAAPPRERGGPRSASARVARCVPRFLPRGAPPPPVCSCLTLPRRRRARRLPRAARATATTTVTGHRRVRAPRAPQAAAGAHSCGGGVLSAGSAGARAVPGVPPAPGVASHAEGAWHGRAAGHALRRRGRPRRPWAAVGGSFEPY